MRQKFSLRPLKPDAVEAGLMIRTSLGIAISSTSAMVSALEMAPMIALTPRESTR